MEGALRRKALWRRPVARSVRRNGAPQASATRGDELYERKDGSCHWKGEYIRDAYYITYVRGGSMLVVRYCMQSGLGYVRVQKREEGVK